MWKNIKRSYKIINLKYQRQHGTKSLNYLMDHILYQIFKINLNISKTKHGEKTDNISIIIYINKIENILEYIRIKTGYCLKILMPKTMKLFGSTNSKITKDKNGENMPHLEITEAVLVYCHNVKNDYQQDSRVLYTFVRNK